jgi:hypothetical protein
MLSATEGDFRHRDLAPAQSLEPNPQPLSPWDANSYRRTEVEPSYFVENGPLDGALKLGPLLLGHIEAVQMDKKAGALRLTAGHKYLLGRTLVDGDWGTVPFASRFVPFMNSL